MNFLVITLFFAAFIAINAAPSKTCYNCNCGKSKNVKIYDGSDQTRILGGKLSDPTDWPFLAKTSEGCTASVIDEQWILSAAHCNEFGTPVTVSVNGADYESEQVIVHEKYGTIDNNNDILLIKLKIPLKNITNVCLQRNVKAGFGALAAAAGYGNRFKVVNDVQNTLGSDGIIAYDDIQWESTDLLHETPVIIQNMSFCSEAESANATRICAGGEMAGTTQGDSGGPLMVVRNDRWVQFGITSNGRYHAVPNNVNRIADRGIYTRVSAYCDWIEQKTGNKVKCQS